MYTIDREADIPLYMQIRDRIIDAIEAAELTPGDKLPPVSALAKEIGVTQATIRRALQDLSQSGYAECHVGRGTFITTPSQNEGVDSPVSSDLLLEANTGGKTESTALQDPVHYARRRLRSGIKKALADIIPLAHKPDTIQLTKGIPDSRLLPAGFLAESTREALLEGDERFLDATSEMGLEELRGEIAMRFNQGGNTITAEQVLITNGSIQGITLVAQSLMEKPMNVICETPCFQGITDTFSSMGHWVETVQRDEQGPIIDQLYRLSRTEPRLLYLCPYAHNPMGTDLSRERYEQIVEWARKTGSLILADEIFKDLVYQERPNPSLMQKLGGEQTLVVSSLSKSVMTGLRLGWVISSPERIRELSQLKRLMDHSSPALIQGLAVTIFRSGRFDDHTQQMKKVYKKRMDTMLHALKTYMPKGVSWSAPTGGFSMLVNLPAGYSSIALLLSAIERGVSFLPGPLFDIDQRYVHTMRLSTAWTDVHQIKEG